MCCQLLLIKLRLLPILWLILELKCGGLLLLLKPLLVLNCLFWLAQLLLLLRLNLLSIWHIRGHTRLLDSTCRLNIWRVLGNFWRIILILGGPTRWSYLTLLFSIIRRWFRIATSLLTPLFVHWQNLFWFLFRWVLFRCLLVFWGRSNLDYVVFCIFIFLLRCWSYSGRLFSLLSLFVLFLDHLWNLFCLLMRDRSGYGDSCTSEVDREGSLRFEFWFGGWIGRISHGHRLKFHLLLVVLFGFLLDKAFWSLLIWNLGANDSSTLFVDWSFNGAFLGRYSWFLRGNFGL